MRSLTAAFALVALAFAGGGAAAPVPASQLQVKLYGAAFPSSELPDGFYKAEVTLGEKPRNGIGRVNVEVDRSGLIAYAIYASAADAARRIADSRLEGDGADRMRRVGRAPGWGKQSHLYVGSIKGKNVFGKMVTNGVTMLVVLRGPVIVMSFSISSSSELSGDMQAARKLLAAGVKHLDRVRG